MHYPYSEEDVIPTPWYVIKLIVKKTVQQFEHTFLFLKALIDNPKGTGAILPSSRVLAKSMASYVVLNDDQIVVELGAGTGAVTRALVASGIEMKKIVAIEYSPVLVKKLRQQFPEIKIIEGDAENLIQLLGSDASRVGSIISGLPLRSMSKQTTQKILEEITTLLPEKGRYIQFTYSMKRNLDYAPPRYHSLYSFMVWLNIPAAWVDVFTR